MTEMGAEAMESSSAVVEIQRFSGSNTHEASSALTTVPISTSRPATGSVKRFVRQQIPDDILNNAALNAAIKLLPSNYNFEIHKTVWRCRQLHAETVALQMPEGLLLYAGVIADILERFASVTHVLIMGDVAFGACCVDDFSASALGANLLIHYGHSCLVPVEVTSIPCLYVFVDIMVDTDHLVESVIANFPDASNIILAGTIQFSSALQVARRRLAEAFPSLTIPKCRPLSPGEVLGCTAPIVPPHESGKKYDAIVFIADGRFHLEAIMIANPDIPAYRYDPYNCVMTRERYDHQGMRLARRIAIEKARKANRWGIILGTLGRQGNPHVVKALQAAVDATGCEGKGARGPGTESQKEPCCRGGCLSQDEAIQVISAMGEEPEGEGNLNADHHPCDGCSNQHSPSSCSSHPNNGTRLSSNSSLSAAGNSDSQKTFVTILLSEISPAKLALFQAPNPGVEPHVDPDLYGIEAFVQVACPRLSIDWGEGFQLPTLNPYEAMVALGVVPGWWEMSGQVEGKGRGKEGMGKEDEARKGEGKGQSEEESGEKEKGENRKERIETSVEEEEKKKVEEKKDSPDKPTITPMTLAAAAAIGVREVKEAPKDYPMDYYSANGGLWSGTYHRQKK